MIDTKIKSCIAKGRNIIYYRGIDDRPYAVYSHILREYRKELQDLISELREDNVEVKETLKRIFNVIPPKVSEKESMEVITKMSEIIK